MSQPAGGPVRGLDSRWRRSEPGVCADRRRSALARWTFSEATFNPDVLPLPEPVQWKSFDSLTISVSIQAGTEVHPPRPVRVSIHGGPDRSDGPAQGRSNYLLNSWASRFCFPTSAARSDSARSSCRSTTTPTRRRGQGHRRAARLDSSRRISTNHAWCWSASALADGCAQAGAAASDRIRGVIERRHDQHVTFLERWCPRRGETTGVRSRRRTRPADA